MRSVRQLQRQLPAALTGLRRRFETYDADADDGDDLEDAYEELCRLDAQGITAQVRHLRGDEMNHAKEAPRCNGF